MPPKELLRSQQVQHFIHLQIDQEKELRDIVQIAAEVCRVPIAMITLVNEQTGEVLLQISSQRDGKEQEDPYCIYVIQQKNLLIIKDSSNDNSFNTNFVLADSPIRFYAGAPLITLGGHCLGSLSAMDHHPGDLTGIQVYNLEMLSRQAIRILEFKMSIEILKEQYTKAKNAETTMRSFFESTASCHLLLGPDFTILAFNKSLKKFVNENLGMKVIEGMDIRTMVHQSNKKAFIDNYETALGGKTVISEVELSYSDKHIYWYIVYEPAYATNGEIIGVSYNATDISIRIRQEQLVLAQNKSLKEIAFIQSHELRRPVSSIMGLMDLIESEDYRASREDMILLKQIVSELDTKIRKIVDFTAGLKIDGY